MIYSLAPPSVLRQGILASPLSHKTRRRVLPYLMKKDLDVGAVDGDPVVENPNSSVRFTQDHLTQAFHKEPLLGVEWDPPICKGSLN